MDTKRAISGGSWISTGHGCQSAIRYQIDPVNHGNDLGFRLVAKLGALHGIRGGSWGSGAGSCRRATRSLYDPEDRDDDLGFRLAADSE